MTQGDEDPLSGGKIDTADFPALMLVPTGGEINLKATSSSANIEQLFDLQLATGSMKLSEPIETASLFYPVKWAVLKALFPIVGGAAFSSDEIDFSLVRLDVVDNSEAFDDTDANEGIEGWSSVLTITAELTIPRATLGE